MSLVTVRKVLGGAIREIRESRGINPRDFAERVGIKPAYLSNVELGYRQPTTEVRERIRLQLDVPITAISYLVDDGQAPPPRRGTRRTNPDAPVDGEQCAGDLEGDHGSDISDVAGAA